MASVYDVLIEHIRSRSSELALTIIENKDTAAIMRLMFTNLRGQGTATRGLRLSQDGLEIMKACFRPYDIERVETKRLTARELMYLDKKAKLPYWIGVRGKLVMFDPDLSIMLKLADGSVATLMDMDATLS